MLQMAALPPSNPPPHPTTVFAGFTGPNASMKNLPIYEALAQAFAAEGVDTQFTLMGDGSAVVPIF